MSMEQEKLFDQYLNDTLDKNTKQEFAQNLTQNEDLRNAFDKYKTLVYGIETFELQKIMEDTHSSIKDAGANKESWAQSNKLWLVLIGIVLITTILLYVLRQNNTTQNQNIYATYYSPDAGLPTTMGVNEDLIFNEGMVAYKNKNYDQAIQKWSTISDNNVEIQYYKASAYLALEKYPEASKIFSKQELLDDVQYGDKSEWYLALIQYRGGDSELLKSIGKTIDHAFHKKANTILKK